MRRARKRSGGDGRRAGYGRGALAAACAVIGLSALLAACGPAPAAAPGGSTAAASGNTVTYAMQPGGQAAYPLPFMTDSAAQNTSGYDSVYNVNDFQYLLYRPLYWFGTGVHPYLNPQISLAAPPRYRGHEVIITLKPNYKWSDGESVDAQDVEFWLNMMIAEGQNGVDYSQTGLPGDITKIRTPRKYVLTMDITTPQFSEDWFTNNELSEITPMPAAWDRTAAGPSDCDTNVASCTAVYNYLFKQASMPPSTFASSPLWGVVDGPWKIQSLNSEGKLVLAFNHKYSGPVVPGHITTFIEVPFSSEAAEFNVLQDPAGNQTIDVGYLPIVDAYAPPAGANVGANARSLTNYRLSVQYAWELSYFPYNFRNTTGQAPIFDQQYFREAFQSLVDQEGVINSALHGYGKPTIGPVASYPATTYLSQKLSAGGDPWILNISKAAALLRTHGWTVTQNGTDTCAHPGPGLKECGPGVSAGAQLKFTMIYATGIDWMQSAARELASNASLAGIQITLEAEPFLDVVNQAFGCQPRQPCTWQLAEWGEWTYSPDYLPTGDTLFAGGAPNNAGDYNSATDNRLIEATLTARTNAEFDRAMDTWQQWLAPQLPVVYQPDTPTLVETINGLDIGTQNSALTITPEDWHYLK